MQIYLSAREIVVTKPEIAEIAEKLENLVGKYKAGTLSNAISRYEND